MENYDSKVKTQRHMYVYKVHQQLQENKEEIMNINYFQIHF